jgi:integrase
MGVKIRERAGAWWLFIDHNGARKAKRVCAVGQNRKESRRAADLAAMKVEVRLAEGELGILEKATEPDPGPTLAAYAKTWLNTHVKNVLAASTRRFYAMNLKEHIVPVIGSKSISGITRADCKAVMASCQVKDLRVASLLGIGRTLSSLLTHAVEDGHLEANPALRLGRYARRKDEPKFEVSPLTRDEVKSLLKAAQEHHPGDYAMLLCAVRTGMRLGELAGLEWGDIQFGDRFIEVRRNRTGGTVTTPKNGRPRRVDMSKTLTKELEALLVRRKVEKLKNGWKELPAHVFRSPDGGPVDGDNFRRRVFIKAVEKAGLRHVRFHDLRHTFASLLIQDGQSLAYVRDQLGHSSIQITADIYGHLVPGANRSAVDRLDDDAQQNESATPPQPSVSEATIADAVSL